MSKKKNIKNGSWEAKYVRAVKSHYKLVTCQASQYSPVSRSPVLCSACETFEFIPFLPIFPQNSTLHSSHPAPESM